MGRKEKKNQNNKKTEGQKVAFLITLAGPLAFTYYIQYQITVNCKIKRKEYLVQGGSA